MEPLSRNIEDYPEGLVLPIDKPYRWTSADVIRKVKYAAIRHFGKKNLKVGHAGTLDPLATGILLVCIGAATKRAEQLQRSPKQYLAGVTFGATTPSYDLEKEIDTFYPLDSVSEESIEAVLPAFIGEQQQVAPLFSAKSVDGTRAYETARKLLKEAQRTGVPFDGAGILQSSTICIHSLTLESFHPAGAPATATATRAADAIASNTTGFARSERIHVADIGPATLPTAMIRVDCSKGTYIRSLARDLGEALGSGAFLSSLRRTRNGGFDIEDSLSLDQTLELFKTQTIL